MIQVQPVDQRRAETLIEELLDHNTYAPDDTARIIAQVLAAARTLAARLPESDEYRGETEELLTWIG